MAMRGTAVNTRVRQLRWRDACYPKPATVQESPIGGHRRGREGVAMIVRSLALGIVLMSFPTAALPQGAAVITPASTVLKTYCVSCHSGSSRAGRFSLDDLDVNNPA